VVEAPIRKAPPGAQLLDFNGRPSATFDNPVLEQDFISYCQMASPIAICDEQLAARHQELLEQAANHIWHVDYESPEAAQLILGDCLLEPVQNIQEPMMRLPEETKMFASLCTTRLLTTEEETSVLRRLHYLKYLAHKTLTEGTIDQWMVARAEGLLRAAQWHRTLFVQCNMRLVVSIVRKLPVPMHRYDELFSDGVVGLLRAIDKFDPCRGFRFCTYATTVIRRECFQQIQERSDDQSYCIQSPALSVLASVQGLADSSQDVEKDRAHWISWQEKLLTLIHRLSRREQIVIRSRYCLGAHRHVKTLQRLAAALKISKERVRQIEIGALNKLKKLASELPAEDSLVTAAD
jgi:RNA polymerase sigma factor (sigma-70 family)